MGIERLDHYSIRTTDVEGTRRFYTEVLGFEVGKRPNFPFPGVWLYQGGIAVVHVVGIDPNDTAGLQDYLGDKGGDAGGTGTIDHVAFLGRDIDGMRAHFEQVAVPFRERTVPNMNLKQIFLEDPNGVTIELNYPQ
jgi:catechol 2,3-dioxygenase-like lactoylglutathione lyase family enzyme